MSFGRSTARTKMPAHIVLVNDAVQACDHHEADLSRSFSLRWVANCREVCPAVCRSLGTEQFFRVGMQVAKGFHTEKNSFAHEFIVGNEIRHVFQ